MADHVASCRIERVLLVTALVAAIFASTSAYQSHAAPQRSKAGTAPLRVDGRVALASLMSISDGHLQSVADSLRTLAETDEARSADWERIKNPLVRLEQRSIPGAAWFVIPDGSYWTVDQGRIAQKLSDRPYFPRLMAGKTVIGDLVVSKSTGKCVAIVAVPIVRDGSVVGALGSSVQLDRLSSLIDKEMALDKSMIFYSFSAKPLLALVWDTQLVFLDPMTQPSLKRPFSEMLAKSQGTVKYVYRGRNRSVIYRKSPVTNWWYAFGIVQGGREVQ